ncbi:MAG: histidine kinase [Massilia sp.]|nr:histidine kinase [Massilia sp.]
MKRRDNHTIVAALAWTAAGGIFALPYILRGGGFTALFSVTINCWLWGALTPLIKRVHDRLSAAIARPLPLLAAHAGCGLALTALYVLAAAALEGALGLLPWNPWANPLGLLDWFYWAMLVYCVIIGALTGLKYHRRALLDELQIERLKRSYAEAQLNTLRTQLDPHFLFNALNGISACVEHEPRLARRMIEHLGGLLRISLDTRHRGEVSLAEEMAFLEHYFALHRMRFAERLAISVSVMPDVEHARIPSLLLQPLVENAIRHGISGRLAGGRITVSARRVGDQVEIRVVDDGVGLPPEWTLDGARGLGLSVTRERLSTMYPDGASKFAVAPHAGGGTEAKIVLPLN